MSQCYTTITLPGLVGPSFCDYGQLAPGTMIQAFRSQAWRRLKEAEMILAAEEKDFRVISHRGLLARNKVEVPQEWKPGE